MSLWGRFKLLRKSLEPRKSRNTRNGNSQLGKGVVLQLDFWLLDFFVFFVFFVVTYRI